MALEDPKEAYHLPKVRKRWATHAEVNLELPCLSFLSFALVAFPLLLFSVLFWLDLFRDRAGR